MPFTMALFCASLLFKFAIAMPGIMPLNGLMPTPMGLMATAGMSPRPTEAPGFNIIPQELRRRQDVQFPPPANWCGFVDGDYDDPLSCSVGMTCVNSMAALGCCTATTGICTNLYTTCLNFGDTCGQACQLDPATRKCSDASEPFCGTYAFLGDTSLFDCQATSAPVYDVEFLNDYYVTAIGSTVDSESASASLGAAITTGLSASASASATDASAFASATDAAGFASATDLSGYASATDTAAFAGATNYDFSSTDDTSSGGGGGLPIAAIDGIAAGVSIIGVAILGAIIFFCLRSRKKKRIAAASRPNIPPSMQQQQQGPPPAYMPPPKAFDEYQTVPQQEPQQQYPQYAPFEQTQTAYQSPPVAPSAVSALSPQPTGSSDPHFSTANTSVFTPKSPEIDGRQSYYQPPTSPDVREVDGTQGNLGVPSPGGHGIPTEVDETTGNPGVLSGGHGIHDQMVAGGSPSATEVEGRVERPYPEGPYELGQNEGR